jgi:hypothetical protein
VLIKNVVLEQIVAGEIDTLFRRQKRPTVKTGGTLRTRAGMLDIVRVDRIELDDITLRDAKRAGFDSVAEAIDELIQRPEGDFYRVRVQVGGVDLRVELRERSKLSADELVDVRIRLDRLDARSARGAWTLRFLTMLSEQPHTRAPDLADSIGWETKPFKDNVRKLKELGLTISHSPGYELSPRGHTVLADLRRRWSDR